MCMVTMRTPRRKWLALHKRVRKGFVQKVILSQMYIIILKAYNPEMYKHGKNYKVIVIKLVFLICRAVS